MLKTAPAVLGLLVAAPASLAQAPGAPQELKQWQLDVISQVGVGYDGRSGQGGVIPRFRVDATRFDSDPYTGAPCPTTTLSFRGDLRPFVLNFHALATQSCIESSLVAAGNMGITSPDLGEVYRQCKAGADMLTTGSVKSNQFLREASVKQKVYDSCSTGVIYFTVGKFSPEYFDFLQPTPVHHRISSWGARLTYRKEVGDHVFSLGFETYADEINRLYFPFGDDYAGYNVAYSQALVRQGVELNNFRIGGSQEAWAKWEAKRADPAQPPRSVLVAVGSRNGHRASYVLTDIQDNAGDWFSYKIQLAYERYGEGHFNDDPERPGAGSELRAHVFVFRPVTKSRRLLVTGRYVLQAARGTASESFQYLEPGLLWNIWSHARGGTMVRFDAFGGLAFGRDGYRSPRLGVAGTVIFRSQHGPGLSPEVRRAAERRREER